MSGQLLDHGRELRRLVLGEPLFDPLLVLRPLDVAISDQGMPGCYGDVRDRMDCHLASDRAGWITGATLPIDGGVLAGRSAPPRPIAAGASA